ncbi:TetR-like C-terminal domain-containing protein [Micromonospora arida]|uniref:TetR-like C-terminal domain-containing protein n=1 Tax=Micromonospora arida TaxID=2203715 RepID=UPI00340780E7
MAMPAGVVRVLFSSLFEFLDEPHVGEHPRPDATHAVRTLGSVFHGYVSLELTGGFEHSAPDALESWKWIVDSLDAVLRNRSTR